MGRLEDSIDGGDCVFMTLTVEQLKEVMSRAKRLDDALEKVCTDITTWYTKGEGTQEYVQAYDDISDYLHTIGYAAVLDVEAILMHGIDIQVMDEPDSLADCYRQVQTEWGGNNGNIDLAIEYITGKLHLHDILSAAWSMICCQDGRIVITEGV